MSSNAGKARKRNTILATARLAVTPATIAGLLVSAALAGTVLGLLAQVLRQVRGPLMTLGASTAPWVMAGFLLAVRGSRGAHASRKAILAATGTIAAYLAAWLVSYHLLFVIRESVSLAAGWHQAAPWLVVAIPASTIMGAIAGLSHKQGPLGDICLAAPIAGSLPEALLSLREGWLDGAAMVVPLAVCAALLIRMVGAERRVRVASLLTAVVALGALGILLFRLLWFPLEGRY